LELVAKAIYFHFIAKVAYHSVHPISGSIDSAVPLEPSEEPITIKIVFHFEVTEGKQFYGVVLRPPAKKRLHLEECPRLACVVGSNQHHDISLGNLNCLA